MSNVHVLGRDPLSGWYIALVFGKQLIGCGQEMKNGAPMILSPVYEFEGFCLKGADKDGKPGLTRNLAVRPVLALVSITEWRLDGIPYAAFPCEILSAHERATLARAIVKMEAQMEEWRKQDSPLITGGS